MWALGARTLPVARVKCFPRPPAHTRARTHTHLHTQQTWPEGMATVSARAPKMRIWATPNGGILERAPKPVPMSANWTEPSRLMAPGKVMPSSCTIMPMNAIIEMRPCLTSTARRRGKEATSSHRPSGSKRPRGLVGGEGRWEGSGEWGVRALARECSRMLANFPRAWGPSFPRMTDPGSTPRPSGDEAMDTAELRATLCGGCEGQLR